MPDYLLDVSHWQGTVDHAKVRAAGIAGCVCKASTGNVAQTTDSGPYFLRAAPIIKRTYPLWGAYHWLRPGPVAPQVANFLAQIIRGYGQLDGCVAALDAEHLDASNHQALTVDDIGAFKREWDRVTGGHPILLYAPRWYWSPLPGVLALQGMGFAGWWASNYVSGSGPYRQLAAKIRGEWAPGLAMTPVAVQFTDHAAVDGVIGDVDVSEIRVSVDVFRAATTRKGDELTAQFEASAGKLLAELHDAIVDGRGPSYVNGRLRADLGYVVQRIEALAARVTAIEQNREAAQEAARVAVKEVLAQLVCEQTGPPA